MKLTILLIANFMFCAVSAVKQPNILFVLADDLGWHDVGWHNPNISTPNLNSFANNGIILNHAYALPMCSPSRSAILTGLYPLRTGMSHSVLYSFSANGLPTKYTLLPEKLKELGYSTHIIGKWHLGYCNNDYLPQSRGFDTAYFIAPGLIDFYTHEVPARKHSTCLFRDKVVDTQHRGTYDLLVDEFKNILKNRTSSQPFFTYFTPNAPHSPLEAPQKFIDLYSEVTNEARRNFSGCNIASHTAATTFSVFQNLSMVSALDNTFGEIVQLLKDSGEYENTIIIFSSDNGGQVKAGGCNYPLRGAKTTLYEGGTRVSAFIHSPLLQNKGYVYDGIIHHTDWYPTIINLAGGSLASSLHIDGFNVWDAIVSNSTSPRIEMVYNIDTYNNATSGAAIRVGRYKLIAGNAGLPNTVVTVDEVTGQFANGIGETGDYIDEPGSPYYRLFDLYDDPYEEENLASRLPRILSELNARLQHYLHESSNSIFQTDSPNGYPSNFGGKCGLDWCEAIVAPEPYNGYYL